MTHAQRIRERVKLPRMDGTDVYQFGLADENARLLPIIQALLADNERLAEILSAVNVMQIVNGFLAQKHVASDISNALAAHTQTLKELAGDV